MDIDSINRIKYSRDFIIIEWNFLILFIVIQHREISCDKTIIIYIYYHNLHKSHSIVTICDPIDKITAVEK